MQSTNGPRKRQQPSPASGTAIPANPAPAFQYTQLPEMNDFEYDFTQPYTGDQMFGSNYTGAGGDTFTQFNGQQGFGSTAQIPPVTTSTDLVRLNRNQQLTTTNNGDQWNGFTTLNNGGSGDEDEQELDMKVQMAKRDAQGKRKQIPPFVQKLSSFLDSNNTDLIRWSDDGRSFIVLDEDEFARTLIPELFKHNNYASFVRQLNMYGFHKTVNITDGSLRQSEKARKGVKPPSMYSHPYFRKNRPDLLWLIQKPSGKSGKRKRDGTTRDESDEERQFSPPAEIRANEAGQATVAQDLTTLPRNELAVVRSELQKLQNQQQYISQMIASLKRQNEQFYQQASTFQALHDRHENSINAILTFLATFLSRNLDGNDAQNLVNMFSSQAQKNQPQHGSVVGEYSELQPELNKQVQRYVRRPLLLEGPAAKDSLSPQDANRVTHNSAQRPSRSAYSSEPVVFEHDASASPAVKTDAPTPDVLHSVPENDEMMNLINSVNASNANSADVSNSATPAVEFNSALNNLQIAAGKTPLTPQQRNTMLQLMAHQQGDKSQNNALVAPQAPAMPDLNQLKQTQQQLEMLTNLQKQQDERVQELNRRLQPLSPTGSIPGLAASEENPFDYTGGPGDFDPNAYVNFDDWGSGDVNFDFTSDGNNGDVNWDFANAGADGGADMFQGAAVNNSGLGVSHAYGADEKSAGRVSSVASGDSPGNDNVSNPGSSKKRKKAS